MLYLSGANHAISRQLSDLGLSAAEVSRRVGITDERQVEALLAGTPVTGVTVMLGRSESEFNINVDLQPSGEDSQDGSGEEYSSMAVDDWMSCMAQHVAGSY